MTRIRRLRTLALTLTVGLTALLAGAPLAVAQRSPEDTDAGGQQDTTPAPAVAHDSPLWVFIVVATHARRPYRPGHVAGHRTSPALPPARHQPRLTDAPHPTRPSPIRPGRHQRPRPRLP
jgi:hypothetical protein